MAAPRRRCETQGMGLVSDFSVLLGLIGLLAFALFCTLRINKNRKLRGETRRITSRLMDWK